MKRRASQNVCVVKGSIERPARTKSSSGKSYRPDPQNTAICDAYIATVKDGQRVVRKYVAGERLVGRLS